MNLNEDVEIPVGNARVNQGVAQGANPHHACVRCFQRIYKVDGLWRPMQLDERLCKDVFQKSFVNELDVDAFAVGSVSSDFFKNRAVGFVEQLGIGDADSVGFIDEVCQLMQLRLGLQKCLAQFIHIYSVGGFVVEITPQQIIADGVKDGALLFAGIGVGYVAAHGAEKCD